MLASKTEHAHTVHGGENFSSFTGQRRLSRPLPLQTMLTGLRKAPTAPCSSVHNNKLPWTPTGVPSTIPAQELSSTPGVHEPEDEPLTGASWCCGVGAAFRTRPQHRRPSVSKASKASAAVGPMDDWSVKCGRNVWPYILDDAGTKPLTKSEVFRLGYVRFGPPADQILRGGAYSVHAGTAFSQRKAK